MPSKSSGESRCFFFCAIFSKFMLSTLLLCDIMDKNSEIFSDTHCHPT